MVVRLLVVVTSLLTSTAAAQHGDVLAFADGGRVAIGQFDFVTLIATPRTVFPARFDAIYSVNDPGFTARPDISPLLGGADLRWDFLPMTVDSGPHVGLVSTLLYWDGLGDAEFGPTPMPDYELSLFGKDGSATADGGDQIVPGGVIERTSANGSIHEHRFFFLDDNGDGLNTTLPQTGVYLLAMRLSIDGLDPSDPFFMVWGTPEASIDAAMAPAVAWVEARVDTLAAPPTPGDYNRDGFVDAADYTVWRDGLGGPGGPEGYAEWATAYSAGAPPARAVPEPAAVAGWLSAACVACARGLRRRGGR